MMQTMFVFGIHIVSYDSLLGSKFHLLRLGKKSIESSKAWKRTYVDDIIIQGETPTLFHHEWWS